MIDNMSAPVNFNGFIPILESYYIAQLLKPTMIPPSKFMSSPVSLGNPRA